MAPARTKLPSPTRHTRTAKPAPPAADPGFEHFLSHISHELRTPLSALLLWARLLDENGGDNPQQLREALDAIKSSANELQAIVEDLVDTSRVLSGRLQLDVRECLVAAAVHAARELVQPSAAEREVRMEVLVDSPEAAVQADPDRLRQVIRNLLRSAVENTPPGGVVQLRVESGGDAVRLLVQDGGAGTPPDQLAGLFDPWARNARPGERPSANIGLAVARQLIERHGGRIDARSGGSERGTVFEVQWPAAPAAPRTEPDSTSARPAAAFGSRPLTGLRVLLVEDAAETRKALQIVLAEAGADVISAESSSVALRAFRAGRIDLVVSDLGLPKMDGYELMEQFRRWERADGNAPAPALALTAYAGDGTRRRALQSGYDVCLTKPLEPGQLVATLAELHAGRG